MMRSAQAEFEDSLAGFDADDEFAMPSGLSEAPETTSAFRCRQPRAWRR